MKLFLALLNRLGLLPMRDLANNTSFHWSVTVNTDPPILVPAGHTIQVPNNSNIAIAEPSGEDIGGGHGGDDD